LFGAVEEAFRKRRAFSFARSPMPNSEERVVDVSETKTKTRADVIREAIKIFEDKFTDKKIKITASEFLRLLELKQQLDGDEPRGTKIRWVEQNEM
jgi:hypothetical protein